VAVAVVVGALVACTGEPAQETPSPDGHLWVGQANISTELPYIEGSHSFLRITGPDGEVVFDEDLEEGNLTRPLADLDVEPGTYRIESWQRPCGPACPSLDPEPTDACEERVVVAADQQVVVTIRLWPYSGCTVLDQVLDPARTGVHLEVGEAYDFALTTRCGIVRAVFDGREWEAAPVEVAPDDQPPGGWLQPTDPGELRLLSPGVAEFTATSGETARFVPVPDGTQPFACD
jgi:hypothetical protein